jgi:ABC-type transport system involved in multi-copper enzyme maturation permease subunit
MSWNEIVLVFMHHMRGLVREPHSFVIIIAFTMLTNLLIGACSDAGQSASGKTSSQPTQLALFGDTGCLRKWFEEPKFKIVDSGSKSAKEIIRAGHADVAIKCASGFCKQMTSTPQRGKPFVIDLKYVIDLNYDSGRLGAAGALSRTMPVFSLIHEDQRDKRLAAAGVPERWKIETTFLSNEGKNKVNLNKRDDTGTLIAMFSVYNLSLMAAIFGEYFLSEEHKRGTFLLLMLSPTSKTSILAANFIATLLITFCLFLPSYVSLLLIMHNGSGHPSIATVSASIDKTILPSLLAAVPLLILASSFAVLASTFLRTKGQQAMFTGLLIGVMECLAAAIFLPHYLVNKFIAFVPVSGSTFVLRDAVLGFYNPTMITISVSVALVTSFLLLAVSAMRLNSRGAIEWIMRSQS